MSMILWKWEKIRPCEQKLRQPFSVDATCYIEISFLHQHPPLVHPISSSTIVPLTQLQRISTSAASSTIHSTNYSRSLPITDRILISQELHLCASSLTIDSSPFERVGLHAGPSTVEFAVRGYLGVL